MRESPARVQWDPERDLHHNPLPYRSLQLGLAGEAAARAVALLPPERPYPLAGDTLTHLLAWTCTGKVPLRPP